MELTLKLKQDIIDLLEFVQTIKNGRDEPWSDSTAAKQCFGHGEYVGNLRKWDGGKAGPTLEKTLMFERFLIKQLTPAEYAKFLKTRTRPVPALQKADPPAVDDDSW